MYKVDATQVHLPPSPQHSFTATGAAPSAPQFTAESFGNLPGADEMATRLNTLDSNITNILTAEDIAQMCHNFTSAFNLEDVLIEQSSQLKAIQILLTLTNCIDKDSIKVFANSKLQDTPDNQRDGNQLKEKANKDNRTQINLPPEYEKQSPNLSFWREQLMASFIDSQFPEANFSEEQKEQLKNALLMAKMQIAANTGIGNFEKPIPYKNFDRATASHLTARITYPRQALCAEKLEKETMALQEQLFNANSGLIEKLHSDKTITQLLRGNQQHHLKKLLKSQGADNSATLTKAAALLVSFASRDPDLAGELTSLGINPKNLGDLAKAHSILNHARAGENTTLTNEIAADGVRKSDKFTRDFFSSEIARDPKLKAPMPAKIALWLVSTNQQG
ncbi:hypothetical protein [Endozoicomonas sp. ONNA2]|uniref:hypothetical protein n=1 Tax=Endozoicomonas sp. ONNA2 TaxID=2828741 RepID=UPI0021497DDC|nr:hypothetical protein [Endozoicomonas sp. ONNA2]